MPLVIKSTCPLGSTCEKVVDNEIHRCAWYINIKGKNPQDGSDIDQWDCAIAWQPIIAIENNGQTRNLVSTFQSLRNTALEQQKAALEKVDGKAIT